MIAFADCSLNAVGALGGVIFDQIKQRLEHSRDFEDNAVKDSQPHDQKPPEVLVLEKERVNLVPLMPSHPLEHDARSHLHRAMRSEEPPAKSS